MRKKLFPWLGLLLVLCLLPCLLTFALGAGKEQPQQPAATSGTISDTVTWSYNSYSKTLTVSGSGELVNTGEIWYDYKSEIKTITINNGITYIGNNILEDHPQLTTLNLPNTLQAIAGGMVNNCPLLEKITVKSGGQYFSSDSKGLLYNGDQTTLYLCPPAISGSISLAATVQTVASNAFLNCSGITGLTLPSSLITIESGAFAGCTGLSQLSLGRNVKTIGEDVFPDSANLKSISVNVYNTYFSADKGILYNYAKTVVIRCPGGYSGDYVMPDTVTSLRDRAFLNCTGLTSVRLSENLTVISQSAFTGCSELTSVTFGSQLTEVKMYAFRDCAKLESAILPDSVTTLGEYAFRYCSSLKTVHLSSSLTSLGSAAFDGCTSLEEIEIPSGVTVLLPNTFRSCTGLRQVKWSDDLTSIGNQCFQSCTALESVSFGGQLKSIGQSAFAECHSLKEVILPPTLTILGKEAFYNCDGLGKVCFTGNVTSFGDAAFSSCSSLKEIDFGTSLTYIGVSAFSFCNLRVVELPSGIQKIGKEAFRANYSLAAVSLPKSLTSVGTNAFYSCSDLIHVYYSGSEADFTAVTVNSDNTDLTEALWHYGATAEDILSLQTCFHSYYICDICGETFGFAYRSGGAHSYEDGICTRCDAPECLTYSLSSYNMAVTITGVNEAVEMPSTLTIPETIEACPVTTIQSNALRDQTGLQILILPANLRSIEDYAFCNCDDLTLLSVPEGLQTIGNGAFQSCGSLWNIDLPNSVTTLGSSAFDSCGTMLWADLGNGVQTIGDYAFLSCGNLVSIHLGKPTQIGYRAFYSCDNLTHVSYGGNVTDWTSISCEDGNEALKSAYRHDLCSESPVNFFISCGGIYAQCDFCDDAILYMDGGGTGHWFEEGICQVCGVPEYLEYTIHPTACTVTVTGFDGSVAEVVIPDTIEGFPVKYIDFQAFAYSEELQKITIGNQVTTIDSGAFRGCINLKEVVLGDSVETIGGSAFHDCDALTTIHLPDSVKDLQTAVFWDCDALVSVTGGSCVEEVGASAFYDCDSLTTFEGGGMLRTLEKYAFYHCDALQSVTLPDTLTTIEEYCFQDCDRLETVTFGVGLKNLGTYAFYDCDALTAVILPCALERICEYTFYSCDSLRYVDTGKVEGWIEFYAFAECSALEELILGGATYLRNYAFENCSALKKVTFPTTLEYSDHTVFQGCTAVEEVHITDLTAWCSIHFGTMSATPLYYGGDLYLNGELLVDLVIPEEVTSIGSYAFLNCKSIETVSLPYGLEAVGTSTFHGCSALKEIYIPSSVTSVGNYAFRDCTSITNAWGMTGLTAIPEGMFDGCSSLVSAKVPYGVTSIGAVAYQECSSLVYASLPSTLTSIGERAFDQCDVFCHVLFTGSRTAWDNIQVDSGNPLLTIVTIHCGANGEEILWYEIEGALYPRCTICDTYLTEKPECFHAEMRLYDEKEPTCTEPGYTGDVWCLVCGECVERGQVIEPLNHPNTRVDGRIEPTCTEPGCTGDTWCYLCDAYVYYSEPIEPLNHPVQEWIGITEATCTGYGYTGDLECLTCGTRLVQGETTEPVGHIYENGQCIYCREPEFVDIPFEDVQETDYYASPVLWAVQMGVTNGTSPTEFSPEDPCTRGQIVTFLWRAFGSPEPNMEMNPFTDVPSNIYYYKAVLWAVEKGITTGTSATTFSPEDTCTRGQVATFLWRACGKPDPATGKNPFSDVSSSVYYYQPILWAVENGVTNGTGGGKFSPEDSCTRGQIVTFLYRALAK